MIARCPGCRFIAECDDSVDRDMVLRDHWDNTHTVPGRYCPICKPRGRIVPLREIRNEPHAGCWDEYLQDQPGQQYTTYGSARGACGHVHHSLRTARECLDRDRREVERGNGEGSYSDRYVTGYPLPLTGVPERKGED